jgi:hypothetical protein
MWRQLQLLPRELVEQPVAQQELAATTAVLMMAPRAPEDQIEE